MKFSKTILLLFSVAILSCGNDDDGSNPIVIPFGEDVNPTSSIDVEAILALVPGSDITDLVTFGNDANVSAADYLSEVELFDTFILDSPLGLAPGDEFLYFNIFFENAEGQPIDEGEDDFIIGGYLEAVLPEGVTDLTRDEYYNQEFWPIIALQVIDADEFEDVEWKYDIECYIRRNGDEFGPYIIDPKLRIKGRTNTLN